MSNSGNIPNRFTFWRVHWQMFKDSPLWGQGYSHLSSGVRIMYYDALGYKDFPERFNAHNMFFETISNIGILGTVMVVLLFIHMYRVLSKFTYGVQLNSKLFKALQLSIILNFIHGLTQNVFYDSGVTVVYTCLLWLVIWSTTKGEHFEV
jgi:O-antigen ligase